MQQQHPDDATESPPPVRTPSQAEFVSLVAHELRTPLTAIKGYTELLLEDSDALGEEQREFLGLIKRNTDRLVERLSELLDMMHLETGRVTLRSTVVDFPALLSSTIQTLRPHYAAKHQELLLHCGTPLPPINGDQERVRQVLLCLLANASRLTPPRQDIRVTVWQQARQVCLEVNDRSGGFSPAEQAKLFTPFFHTTEHLPPRVRDVSLGLAVAQRLIELHQGTLTVSNVPGHGATFRMTLPVAAQF